MDIQTGKAQIFNGQTTQRGEGFLDGGGAVPHAR
jgi:hypothetical protein